MLHIILEENFEESINITFILQMRKLKFKEVK